MRRPRFTIASLLAVVLFLAVGLAALRQATDLWDSAVFGLTVAALLTSVLLAVHRREEKRAYWMGFALFGIAYLGLSLLPPIEPRLPTTKGLAYLDSRVSDRSYYVFVDGSTAAPGGGEPTRAWAYPKNLARSTVLSPGAAAQLWDPTTGTLVSLPIGTAENFARIGHSLLALIFAGLGAHLSRALYAPSRPVEVEVVA